MALTENGKVRHWKRWVETGEDYPPRQDLTLRQKRWLERAWTWASTAILGMDKPVVPDAVPRYNEGRGFRYVPAIERDWNHIEGIGETTRLEGGTNYNRPENIVPLSRREHTGKGIHFEDAADEYITHRDMYEARQKWPLFKQGKLAENPMQTLHDDRVEATGRGEIYHDDSYDEHFGELADWVVSSYLRENPNDPFPVNGRKK